MKNLFKLFFIISIAGILLNSCNEEVAFDALTEDFDPSVKGGVIFGSGNMLYEVENNATGNDTIPVTIEVWGAPSTADVVVNITVENGSTAVAGKHYTLSANNVTIPANKGGKAFNIIMHNDKFAKGDTVSLKLKLNTDGFNTDLYASAVDIKLSKKPECPFDIKRFTGAYVADERGYGKYNVTFRADETNPTRIWQSNFWDWTDDLLAFDLDPETNTVTVPEQVITMGDGKGYTVVGSGTFDPCTGVMILDFLGDVEGTHEEYSPGSI